MKYVVTHTMLGANPNNGAGPWSQGDLVHDTELEGLDMDRLLSIGVLKPRMVAETSPEDTVMPEEVWTTPTETVKEEPKFAPSPLAEEGIVTAEVAATGKKK